MTITFVGGRTNALIQTVIRGIIGIGFIVAGIITSIIGKEITFLVIFGIIGIIALLNSWYWWRRAQKFS